MTHRTALLALALTLGVAPVTHVAASHALEIGQAEAAEFKGRIRRVRIREQWTGNGYRTRVVVDGGPGETAGQVDVVVQDPDTGAVVAEGRFDLGAPGADVRARRFFSGGPTVWFGPRSTRLHVRSSMVVSWNDGTTETLDLGEFDGDEDGDAPWTDFNSDTGLHVRVKADAGVPRVRIHHEDRGLTSAASRP